MKPFRADGAAANVPGTPVNVPIAQNTGAANPETRFVVTSSRDACTHDGSMVGILQP